MNPDQINDPVRQQAVTALMNHFVQQGHPDQYAKFMAMATIFQADLELRNAQVSRLLSWLHQEHPLVHAEALKLVEATTEEFEKRVQQ
ncbi:MAG: hypothetical protein VKJ64_12470 [Leptolyngbyaceae bacterium]|nr:hypothetical protein [Leptolyngbyaceae bacterium]